MQKIGTCATCARARALGFSGDMAGFLDCTYAESRDSERNGRTFFSPGDFDPGCLYVHPDHYCAQYRPKPNP